MGGGVCADAVATLEGVRVDVYGDGPDRSALETFRDQLGLNERVRFHGFATYDVLPDVYRSRWGASNRSALAFICSWFLLGGSFLLGWLNVLG